MDDAEIRLVDLLAAKMVKESRVITIKEVAEACKMSRQNASRWFNNQVKTYPSKTIAALCRYFECTPSDFIIVKNEQVSQ